MKSVYCAVRTGSLNKAFCTSYLKGYFRRQNLLYPSNRRQSGRFMDKMKQLASWESNKEISDDIWRPDHSLVTVLTNYAIIIQIGIFFHPSKSWATDYLFCNSTTYSDIRAMHLRTALSILMCIDYVWYLPATYWHAKIFNSGRCDIHDAYFV